MANSIFHDRLRECIAETGKSQKYIAEKLNLTPQAFSYYVNGREPSYEVLGDMAVLFGKSTDYLLGLTDFACPESESANKELGLSENATLNLITYSEQQKKALNSFLEQGQAGTFFVGISRAMAPNQIQLDYKLMKLLDGDDGSLWAQIYELEEQRVIQALKKVLDAVVKPLYNATILTEGDPDDGEREEGTDK